MHVTMLDKDIHVLVVAGSGILLIGGDVEHCSSSDGVILVVNGVSGTDLGSFLYMIDRLLEKSFEQRYTLKQLTVSRAMAIGRPAWVRSASRAWSITDWWY